MPVSHRAAGGQPRGGSGHFESRRFRPPTPTAHEKARSLLAPNGFLGGWRELWEVAHRYGTGGRCSRRAVELLNTKTGRQEQARAAVRQIRGIQLRDRVEAPGAQCFAHAVQNTARERHVGAQSIIAIDTAGRVDLVQNVPVDVPVDAPVVSLVRPDGADDRVHAAA